MVRVTERADDVVNSFATVLRKEPEGPLSTFAATAIGNQFRVQDAEIFEALASGPVKSGPMHDLYESLAKKLKTHSPCD